MEQIKRSLRESKSARWTALVILSFTMFAGYMFTEVISPLKPILERAYGWDSTDYGILTSSYGMFNVFFFMLLIVGVLLDKFGIRFSTIASVLIMIIGGSIKFYAFKGGFSVIETVNVFGLWEIKEQVFYASLGYALFGVGVEYAGITVSKAVVKWFKGKEMALAMGMQVAIARLGSAVPLFFGAYLANSYGVANWILGVVVMLIVGLAVFFYYNMMDRKLDKQLGEEALADGDGSSEDEFKFSDLIVIFSNRGFWLIALLCVLFYSAVFPFYKYGPDLMVNKFGVPDDWAGILPGLVPFGTMLLTPVFGSIYDKKGKGSTIMIIGAVLLIIVHLIFYIPFITSVVAAFLNVLILGIAFSLVPSAMWPSVPKIIPEKQLGSAYATIFWIQNVGLWGIPLLVGIVLNSTNPTISPDKKIVQNSFKRAYVEVVANSNLMDTKTFKGEELSENDLKFLARETASGVVQTVVAKYPQKKAIVIEESELRKISYDYFVKLLTENLSGIKVADLVKYDDDNNNVAIAAFNESSSDIAAQFISEKKVKLNYDYEKTWLIFVILTFVALIVAILLKMEDKRKGYGLELPNIQEEK